MAKNPMAIFFKNLKNATMAITGGRQSIPVADTGGGRGRRIRHLGASVPTPAKANTASIFFANPAELLRDMKSAGSPFVKYKNFFAARGVESDAPTAFRPKANLAKKKAKALTPFYTTSAWPVGIVGQSVIAARRRALIHLLVQAALTPPRSSGLLTDKTVAGDFPDDTSFAAPQMSPTQASAHILRPDTMQLILELPAAFAKANGLKLAAHNHLQMVVYNPLRLSIPIILRPIVPIERIASTSIEVNDAILAINGPTSSELTTGSIEVGYCLSTVIDLPQAKNPFKNCPRIKSDPACTIHHFSTATEAAPAQLLIVSAESLKLQKERYLVHDHTSGPKALQHLPIKHTDNSIDEGLKEKEVHREDEESSVDRHNLGDNKELVKDGVGSYSNRDDHTERDMGTGLGEGTKDTTSTLQDSGSLCDKMSADNSSRGIGASMWSRPDTTLVTETPTKPAVRVLPNDIDPLPRPNNGRSRVLRWSRPEHDSPPIVASPAPTRKQGADVLEPTPAACTTRSLSSSLWACEDSVQSPGTAKDEKRPLVGDKTKVEMVDETQVSTVVEEEHAEEKTSEEKPVEIFTLGAELSMWVARRDQASLSNSKASSTKPRPSRGLNESMWSRTESSMPLSREEAHKLRSSKRACDESPSFNSRQAWSPAVSYTPTSSSTRRGQGVGGKQGWNAPKYQGRQGGWN